MTGPESLESGGDFRRKWTISNVLAFTLGVSVYRLTGHGLGGDHVLTELSGFQALTHSFGLIAMSALVTPILVLTLRRRAKVHAKGIVVLATGYFAAFWVLRAITGAPWNLPLAYFIFGIALGMMVWSGLGSDPLRSTAILSVIYCLSFFVSAALVLTTLLSGVLGTGLGAQVLAFGVFGGTGGALSGAFTGSVLARWLAPFENHAEAR